MWNDPAHKVDWRGVAVHDDKNVKGFFGDYRFLSNFFPGETEFEGLLYPSSENAYQAAKIIPKERAAMQLCSAAESKRLWKKFQPIYTPEQWDKVKLGVMAKVVFDKFLRNLNLQSALLLTAGKYLEETNWWMDEVYGVNYKTGVGTNHLGKILMATREYFKNYP